MFQSAQLKIRWANKHIDDFNAIVNTFIKTDFYAFSLYSDAQTGRNRLNFSITSEIPFELSMILGDAVHNLRAALDLAYFELVSLVGESPTKWTTFRVWDDKKKLIDTLAKGIFKNAPDIVDMLAEQVSAYVGGNVMLSALDDLDIDDKHRTLIPTFSITRVNHVHAFFATESSRMEFHDCSFIVEEGNTIELTSFSGPGKIEVKHRGVPSFAVLFGNGTNLEGKPIVPTLNQFSELVTGVVDIFASTIRARRAS